MFIPATCGKLQSHGLQPWQCAVSLAHWLSSQQHYGARYSNDTTSDEVNMPLHPRLSATVIWGAKAGVGKTLASVGLAAAAARMELPLLYLKPVQLGFPRVSDARLVAAASNSVLQTGAHAGRIIRNSTLHRAASSNPAKDRICKVLYAWSSTDSPNQAALKEGRPISDKKLVRSIAEEVQHFTQRFMGQNLQGDTKAATSIGLGLIETTGGVATPRPAGSPMCDVLRPFRLPALLIGDPSWLGSSATITAYDSLIERGYDVTAILMLNPSKDKSSLLSVKDQLLASRQRTQMRRHYGLWSSIGAIKQHVLNSSKQRLLDEPTPVIEIAGCLPAPYSPVLDDNIKHWVKDTGQEFEALLRYMHKKHQERLHRLQASRGVFISEDTWNDICDDFEDRVFKELFKVDQSSHSGGGFGGESYSSDSSRLPEPRTVQEVQNLSSDYSVDLEYDIPSGDDCDDDGE